MHTISIFMGCILILTSLVGIFQNNKNLAYWFWLLFGFFMLITNPSLLLNLFFLTSGVGVSIYSFWEKKQNG